MKKQMNIWNVICDWCHAYSAAKLKLKLKLINKWSNIYKQNA